VASIKFDNLEVPAARLERAEYVHNLEHGVPPTAVYVCLDNEAHAVQAGLALQKALAGTSVPITVRKHRDYGIVPFDDDEPEESTDEGRPEGGGAQVGDAQVKSDEPRLRIFPLLNRTCRPMLAQSTALNGVLARLAHAEWLREQEQQRVKPEAKPTMRPWDKLSDQAKNWNRSQAAHIPVKLALLGCRAIPTPAWDVPLYVIPEEKVELLARVEHERWVKERTDAGWKWGPRDDDGKPPTHPDIMPWELLDESTRKFDRLAVRGIPKFLAKAGYQVEQL
jgi:hypothetical protein